MRNAVLEWFRAGAPRRILPFLGSRVDELDLSDAVAEACVTATAEAWGLKQQAIETATSVLELFNHAGIEVIALRVSLSPVRYSPHRLRAIGDLDLLVGPGEHRRAVRVLNNPVGAAADLAPRAPAPCHPQLVDATAKKVGCNVLS
jgi:hypothetical protein